MSKIPLYAMFLICLTEFALYLAQGALTRNERMLFIVMMCTALIFWNRLRKTS
jgi:hypothetical protein